MSRKKKRRKKMIRAVITALFGGNPVAGPQILQGSDPRAVLGGARVTPSHIRIGSPRNVGGKQKTSAKNKNKKINKENETSEPPQEKESQNRGQATTEVVLMLPLFMFFLFAFAKTFALLVLVQKMEIASYYAARRWQLESHRNVQYEGHDDGALCNDIEKQVEGYLGMNNPQARDFLGLQSVRVCPVTRTQVWNVVTLTVKTKPVNVPLFKNDGFKFEVVKYVPNRDRPIAFVLPGLQP